MRLLLAFTLLAFGSSPRLLASLLYDNTSMDTGDTLLYSVGPYIALGDQIQMVSAGNATQAMVQLFNNGGAGTFDAELDFFEVGSPVGSFLGSASLTGISSVGLDVLNLTFNLGAGIMLPQDLVWTVSVSNASTGMDLGVDFYEPPTVGSSDNSFMIAATSGPSYSQLTTNSEDVFFQVSGTAQSSTPEASSLVLMTGGLLFLGTTLRSRRRSSARCPTQIVARWRVAEFKAPS